MIFFYQIFIRLFSMSAGVASLFSRKARLFVVGRRNLFNQLSTFNFERSTSELIWFHCSSLGEFEQARPLIERFKVQGSRFKVLITFFSPSGYEIRKNYDGADLVCYLPVDTRSNAKRFLDIVKPAQVFFVKYDFWYNYLNELNGRKVPTYMISANFRAEQFAGFYGKYLRKVLPFFNHLFVQNEDSQKLLAIQNISNVTVSGDLRFDRVSQTVASVRKNPIVEMFKGESRMIVCGSTWEPDERIVANCQLPTAHCKLIIAPHEIAESHIHSLIQSFAPSSILRYSEISKEPVSSALIKLQKANILIIDNIGMLSSLYLYASVAYIGGGFGASIHNILEAAAFGVPVVFGPNHHKFPEAKELITAGGAFEIADAESLKKSLELLFSDDLVLKMASMTCKNFVQGRRGAAERILQGVALK